MESSEAPSRRAFLQRVLLGGAASLAFPTYSRAQGEPFRFGLTPVFLSNDLELLSHLRGYLETKLGGPVELVSRRTYQEITALLVSGQVHAAWICGYPFVQSPIARRTGEKAKAAHVVDKHNTGAAEITANLIVSLGRKRDVRTSRD